MTRLTASGPPAPLRSARRETRAAAPGDRAATWREWQSRGGRRWSRRLCRWRASPTGTPPGICTIERSESSPLSAAVCTGTPSTGSIVCAEVMPGRCAAPPAPAMITSMPRDSAPCANSAIQTGVRWAETTCFSNGTSKLLEHVGGMGHRVPVGRRSHDHRDQWIRHVSIAGLKVPHYVSLAETCSPRHRAIAAILPGRASSRARRRRCTALRS